MLRIAAALDTVLRSRGEVQANESAASLSEAATLLTRDILASARKGPQRLCEALKTGLEEASRRIDRVSIAVTGLAWLGSGVSSLEQEMLALIKNAEREVLLCAYTITPSAQRLLSELGEVVSQGVFATIALNNFSKQADPVQTHLKALVQRCPERWRLFDFGPGRTGTELHAKALVVDRAAALVGSANLSFHGMSLNHEMAVVVRGPTAESIAARIDLLLTRAQPVRFD